MKFKLTATDKHSKARAGIIKTDHGKIHTPIFMPVGTAGTVKAVHQRELKKDIQAQTLKQERSKRIRQDCSLTRRIDIGHLTLGPLVLLQLT